MLISYFIFPTALCLLSQDMYRCCAMLNLLNDVYIHISNSTGKQPSNSNITKTLCAISGIEMGYDTTSLTWATDTLPAGGKWLASNGTCRQLGCLKSGDGCTRSIAASQDCADGGHSDAPTSTCISSADWPPGVDDPPVAFDCTPGIRTASMYCGAWEAVKKMGRKVREAKLWAATQASEVALRITQQESDLADKKSQLAAYRKYLLEPELEDVAAAVAAVATTSEGTAEKPMVSVTSSDSLSPFQASAAAALQAGNASTSSSGKSNRSNSGGNDVAAPGSSTLDGSRGYSLSLGGSSSCLSATSSGALTRYCSSAGGYSNGSETASIEECEEEGEVLGERVRAIGDEEGEEGGCMSSVPLSPTHLETSAVAEYSRRPILTHSTHSKRPFVMPMASPCGSTASSTASSALVASPLSHIGSPASSCASLRDLEHTAFMA